MIEARGRAQARSSRPRIIMMPSGIMMMLAITKMM
jgi:hypothetical protein